MTDPVFPATLASQFASAPVSRHFADAALIQAMGRFEAALALAQAEVERDRKFALPLAPNRLPEAPLPNEAPMSAPLPC